MNKILVATLLLMPLLCKAQIPPNLLGMPEDSVKKAAVALNFTLQEVTYSKSGVRILNYFSDYSLTKRENSVGNTMAFALYRFDLPTACTKIFYEFIDTRDLDPIVRKMDANKDFKRKSDVFGWESLKFNFDINIVTHDDGKGFTFEYVWLTDIRNKQ